jgi:hypothetical protein
LFRCHECAIDNASGQVKSTEHLELLGKRFPDAFLHTFAYPGLGGAMAGAEGQLAVRQVGQLCSSA